MKNRYVEGFKPCPLCGKIENLAITGKDSFYDLQGKSGRTAIHIECIKCNLKLWDFTFNETNYDKRVYIIRKKWNRRRYSDETE